MKRLTLFIFFLAALLAAAPFARACPPGSRKLFVPDIEGRKENLDSLMGNLRKGGWVEEGPAGLRLAKNRCVIFLGDLGDHGPASLEAFRLANQLQKNSAPGAVALLAGNRENFADLPALLAPESLRKVPDGLERWIENQIGLGKNRELAERLMGRARADVLADPVVRFDFLNATKRGAAGALFHERTELARQRGVSHELVPQEEVVEGFVKSVSGGARGEYLARSQLGVFDEATGTLTVHSAVPADFWGIGPDGSALELRGKAPSLAAWIEAHNVDFGKMAAAALRGDSEAVGYLREMSGNPGGFLYGNFGDADKKIKLPSLDLSEALKASGVKNVVVGHKPAGDIAVAIRDPDTGVLYFFIDTSFSSHRRLPVVVQDANGRIKITSMLKMDDGSLVKVVADSTDPLLGRIRPDGRVCAGYYLEGKKRKYVYHREGDHHRPQYSVLTESQASSRPHFKAGNPRTPRMSISRRSETEKLIAARRQIGSALARPVACPSGFGALPSAKN